MSDDEEPLHSTLLA